jgi:AraC-like DNA-binding protein
MLTTLYQSTDFSTGDRADAWQDLASRSVMPISFALGDPACFTGTLRAADLEYAQLTTWRHSPLDAARTPALIRRSDPEIYVLALTLCGGLTFQHGGRTVTTRVGDLTLFDSSRPFTAVRDGNAPSLTETLNLQVPKSLIPLPPDAVASLAGTRLSEGAGIDRVTAATLATMNTEMAAVTPGDATRLGTIATDLFAAVVAHHLDRQTSLPPDTRATALLSNIEMFIRQHLSDARLTPEVIAAAHFISVRKLHRLFEHRDITVAAYIRSERLENCRRDLAAPAPNRRPVHAIAARWGFTCPAHFSRTFRAAYGLTPSEYRNDMTEPTA